MSLQAGEQLGQYRIIATIGDGRLDVFVVGGYGTSTQPQTNHGRAYVLAAGEGRRAGWPMFRHDLRHSGTYTVNREPIPALSSWGILVMLLLVVACGSAVLQRRTCTGTAGKAQKSMVAGDI